MGLGSQVAVGWDLGLEKGSGGKGGGGVERERGGALEGRGQGRARGEGVRWDDTKAGLKKRKGWRGEGFVRTGIQHNTKAAPQPAAKSKRRGKHCTVLPTKARLWPSTKHPVSLVLFEFKSENSKIRTPENPRTPVQKLCSKVRLI